MTQLCRVCGRPIHAGSGVNAVLEEYKAPDHGGKGRLTRSTPIAEHRACYLSSGVRRTVERTAGNQVSADRPVKDWLTARREPFLL